jgi:hypothetical protein
LIDRVACWLGDPHVHFTIAPLTPKASETLNPLAPR